MSLTTTSRATGKFVKTTEKSFAVTGALLEPRKLLAGGYDPSNTSVEEGVKYTVSSATAAAKIFGYGSQLHRMALYHFKGASSSVTVDCLALPAADSGVASTKTITFATAATAAGTYYFRLGSYLDADLISLSVAEGDAAADVADELVTAVTNKPNLPFSASATDGVVTLTAKTADSTSDDLLCTVNIGDGEDDELPEGMTVTIADGTTGSGTSDLSGLVTYLSAEDTKRYTSLVQPYKSTTVLNTLSNLGGNPNDVDGLYDDLDYRPFNSYVAETTGGYTEMATLIALGEDRIDDCTNVMFAAPSYPELGYEIAAYISGVIDKQSLTSPANEYGRLSLSYLWGPVTASDDFTTHAEDTDSHAYDNRDSLVKAGIAPVVYKNGTAHVYDTTGFWNPDDDQNAPFKYVVNRIKIWNIQKFVYDYLNSTDLMDCPIVNSVAAVRASERPIDTDTIKAGLAQVAGYLENYGILYAAKFTINNLTVTEDDDNPDRFDITFPAIVSGNNRVNSADVEVDRNLQAVDITITTSA